MLAWTGSLQSQHAGSINDVQLSGPGDVGLHKDALLRFAAIVDNASIPLYIRCSPILDVHTSASETASWFDLLLCGDSDQGTQPWWQSNALQSDLGILASIEQTLPDKYHGPRPTEVLFFALKSKLHDQTPLTPPHSSGSSIAENISKDDTIELRAILLSADLRETTQAQTVTPPATPDPSRIRGVFVSCPSTTIPAPAASKRKTPFDAFEEASKKRQKLKRNLGGSVAEAAASLHESSTPTGLPPLRPSSRASSVQHQQAASCASSAQQQAAAVRAPSNQQHAKSRAASPAPSATATTTQVSPLETKNKALLSRLILTGMRLYGLSSSSSSSKTRPSSTLDPVHPSHPTPAAPSDPDAEYKYTYHAALRFLTYQFRTHMLATDLGAHTDVLRENVDHVLGLLCVDPLTPAPQEPVAGTPGLACTPFQTPREKAESQGAWPFPSAASAVVETPLVPRRRAERDVVPGMLKLEDRISLSDGVGVCAMQRIDKGKGRAVDGGPTPPSLVPSGASAMADTVARPSSNKRRREPGF